MTCSCKALTCEGHGIYECRWQIMRRAGWRSPTDEPASESVAQDIAAIRSALDEAGLMFVRTGRDSGYIVCRPGRFEHAKVALALDK